MGKTIPDTSEPKRAMLTMRLPESLHAALVNSAEKEGLSLSAEVERRVRRTFDQDAEAGDSRLSALLRAMSAQAFLIIEAYGELNKSDEAGKEIMEAWRAAIRKFVPVITGSSRGVGKEQSARRELSEIQLELKALEQRIHDDREKNEPNPIDLPSQIKARLRDRNLQQPEIIPDQGVRGGAVDALKKEYEKSWTAPADDEQHWAELYDKMLMLQHANKQERRRAAAQQERRRAAARLDNQTKLVTAMMRELAPFQRERVLRNLESDQKSQAPTHQKPKWL